MYYTRVDNSDNSNSNSNFPLSEAFAFWGSWFVLLRSSKERGVTMSLECDQQYTLPQLYANFPHE